MQAQSLSIVVPRPLVDGKVDRCVNRCKFCCSHMHEDSFTMNDRWMDKDYLARLIFASRAGVDSVVLTGDGEPLQNWNFLERFFQWNNALQVSFQNIDLQTSGVFLDNKSLVRLRDLGVTTIALSINDIFNDENHAKIACTPRDLRFKLDDLCKKIKSFGFNLRLSLNMLNHYMDYTDEEIFKRCKQLGADQVIFRKMYTSVTRTREDDWVKENALGDLGLASINTYVVDHGTLLGYLSFGAKKYSVDEMSVVVDNDCMSQEAKVVYRYLILQSDGKLYTRWNDRGSLIF